MLAGIMLPVLIGFGALAVDLGHSRTVQVRLQSAADAAALAASQKLPNLAAARAAALDLASKNVPTNYGTVTRTTDVVFGTYDETTKAFTATTTNPTAVQVTAGRTTATGNAPPTFFARVLGSQSGDVSTRAIAYRNFPPYCVIVLDPSTVNALSISGNGTFQVPNCGVQVNSGHNKAASAGNSTTVTARNFCLVGGYNGTFSPTPTTNCAALADPLSSLPDPAGLTASCAPAVAAVPGTYCGSIAISSAVTLAPGDYYFKNATVTIGSGANITGAGVTWFFDANSSLTVTSNADVNLSAPSSGPYSGIVMYQSRSAPTNNVMSMTGGANFILDGTIYMPKANLQLTGNTDVTVNSKTGYIITNKLSYTGSSTFSVGTWGGSQASAMFSKTALVQ